MISALAAKVYPAYAPQPWSLRSQVKQVTLLISGVGVVITDGVYAVD